MSVPTSSPVALPSGSENASTKTPDNRVATVIVPCFNESESIAQLHEKLEQLVQSSRQLGDPIVWHFVFVDDGSSDDTHQRLQATFSTWPNATILRHPQNRGLINALQTGFHACTTPWVAVIDSDCTYNPLLLIKLLDQATQQHLDVVTASPYHPQGSVGNVPAWRIALSRIASQFYRWPMRNQLSCYTCCVRVYRTELVRDCKITSPGFVGVTELLWRLDQKQARMGEHPAELHPRTTGVSKMRTLKTTLQHFRLLARIAGEIIRGQA